MSQGLPRAVLDSSVVVAGWSRRVLQRLASSEPPRFEPVWSEWIVAETWRVLTWRACKAGASWQDISAKANAMLRYLIPVMRPVALREALRHPPWPELTDPDDEPVWATAVLASAQYVVSDNTSDFPPNVGGRHVYAGVEYLTAIEFIEDVLGEDAAVLHGGDLPRMLPRSGRSRSPLLPPST